MYIYVHSLLHVGHSYLEIYLKLNKNWMGSCIY